MDISQMHILALKKWGAAGREDSSEMILSPEYKMWNINFKFFDLQKAKDEDAFSDEESNKPFLQTLDK